MHYQERFVLKGPRIGKKQLLAIFSEKWNIVSLAVAPETSYDSTLYCTKSETRVRGPWFVGLSNYTQKSTTMELDLCLWQEQVIEMLSPEHIKYYKDRKVIWIEDSIGGAGKSKFMQYLE